MESSRLVQAFTQLSTSDSRLNTLEALINELTPYEWRLVQSLVNARTFQCDIIGQLPVELVSHILSYLDTCTPWRLQLVSRPWFEKLQSLVVLKPSLDCWYNGTVDLQGANLDFCRRKAQSIHAFRHASRSIPPDVSFKVATPFGLTQHVLVGDNLIWLAQGRRQVHVLNLRSLTPKNLVPMARETIHNIYASNELVAFTVQMKGTVYVGELNNRGPIKSFRFVNSSLSFTLTCRHRTVACAGHVQDSVLIYIWNYDSQQGKSFNISNDLPILPGTELPPPIPGADFGLLLQPDTETIILCQAVPHTPRWNPSDCPQVVIYQFNYTGDCLHWAKHMLDGYSDDNRTVFGVRRNLNFVPASHNGLFMLQCTAWAAAHGVKPVHTLEFDERTYMLTIPEHPRLSAFDPLDQGNVVWWKDTFIEAGTKDHIIVHRGTISEPRHDPVVAYARQDSVHMTERIRQLNAKDLLINDRYIVRPYCDVFYIYCYDHTVQLPEESGVANGVGPWEVIKPSFATVRECVNSRELSALGGA